MDKQKISSEIVDKVSEAEELNQKGRDHVSSEALSFIGTLPTSLKAPSVHNYGDSIMLEFESYFPTKSDGWTPIKCRITVNFEVDGIFFTYMDTREDVCESVTGEVSKGTATMAYLKRLITENFKED